MVRLSALQTLDAVLVPSSYARHLPKMTDTVAQDPFSRAERIGLYTFIVFSEAVRLGVYYAALSDLVR